MYGTQYLERNFLNTMRNITFTAPTKLYLKLYITSPTNTGTSGIEIQYSGYKPKEIQFTPPAPESGGIGIKSLSDITFEIPDIDSGTVSYIGISDSPNSGSGNLLAWGQLEEELVIRAGEPPVILAGDIVYYSTGDLTTSYKTKLLNIFRNQSVEGFKSYHAFFSGNPEAGGSEFSGGNYDRAELFLTAPKVDENGQTYLEASEAIKYKRATANWGIWAYSAIMNAGVGGEAVWTKEKVPTREIKNRYMPYIDPDDPRAVLRVGIN